MKKLLSVLLALVLTLSLAAVAMADISISGQWSAGYLYHPGWTGEFDNTVFADGGFFGQYRWFSATFTKEVSPRDDVTAGVVFQIDFYDTEQAYRKPDDGTGKPYKFPSPVKNFYLVYDPGFAKFTFDAKGRDVVMGIASEELLKLNIARRFALNGEPNIYRSENELAKQLTVEVPLGDLGKAVAVVGLEQHDGSPLQFVGAFAQFYVGPGTVGLGYQPEMSSYPKPTDSYFVIATDFDITDRIRLQADYSTQNDYGAGYPAYWRATWMETYNGTPFNITGHLNSILTIDGVHQIKARLLNTAANGMKYWIDGSYKLNDIYRVGINYRNWAFDGIDKFDGAAADASIIEVYGKYEAGPNLTAFFRTDGSFGFIVEIGFW
jgi:hypothetical protein